MPKNAWMLVVAGLCLCGPAPGLGAASNGVQRAGAPYTIDVWQTDDGLPQNSVISMIQTRDGYLWLGTLNGLVRFDGIRFTVFDENNTPGLNSSRIVHLFEDSQNGLWIGTEAAGLALAREGQVTHLEIGQGSRGGRLVSACEDAAGAVWLYTADGQLWRHQDGRFSASVMDRSRPSNYRAIIAEQAGPVWVGTDGGLSSMSATPDPGSLEPPLERSVPVGKLDFLLASRRGGHWRLADGRVQKWTANRLERDSPYLWNTRFAPVTAACEDRDGNLVVGTLGAGVFWYDATGQATSVSTNQGLSHNYVLSLVVDREGTLWVGTDGGGLNRVRRQVFDTLPDTRGWVVQTVSEDAEGGLWIGANGTGTGCWKNGEMQRYGYGQGLVNLYVRAVFADRDNRIWAGTFGGGLSHLTNGMFRPGPGTEMLNRQVSAVHQDRAGRLWAGTQGGLARWDGREWKVFTARDGLSSEVIRAIADDRDGNLWIGTEGGGLNQMREGQFGRVREEEGAPRGNIACLWVDDEGVLWVGTVGHGLARRQGGKWTRFTTREGLASNSIGYVVEDEQGHLWMGSNAGLMRVAKKALNDFARGAATFIPMRTYGKADGLPTRECTQGSQPAACRTRDGRLWFPTIKGLASVAPAQLTLNTNPPPVVIEAVLVEGQAQSTNTLRPPLPRAVTVPAGKERLEIHYTSLNLTAPDRARFLYRLEGHETAWTEAGDTRVARYSKLPPGQYRFQVKACNEDGVWNEAGCSVAFDVQPPFWRTWWFLTAAAAGLLGTIVALVHYFSTQRLHRQLESLRQQEALEQERSRIARDIHDQLGANLTQVALLGELVESDKNSPADVEAHGQQIAQTARDTARSLDQIVWTVNPSNDTLEGLINYVCKYAQEYLAVAGLRYRLDVPAQLPATPIPPEVRHNVFLASKEAVTNVVRHAKATAAWIRLRLEPGSFTLEIEDNGRGVAGLDEQAAQTRNGLRNMRRRMEDVGGGFSIGPGAEGGALIRLTVPIRNR